MMAQSRAESTRDTYKYGQYINQFPQNTIKVIREFERIQKKICRHKMSIMFNEICINILFHIFSQLFDITHTSFLNFLKVKIFEKETSINIDSWSRKLFSTRRIQIFLKIIQYNENKNKQKDCSVSREFLHVNDVLNIYDVLQIRNITHWTISLALFIMYLMDRNRS